MSNEKIDELKVKFETGKIPDGDDYALFIDNTYNRYRIVDMFNPNDAPKTFNEGENVLVFNYKKADNPEWAALLGDGVADGDIMVRTFHYAGAGVTFQEFDTERNGRFYAGRSRVAVDENTWGTINIHPEIRTVNGNGPDVNGNIDVTGGGGTTVKVIDNLTTADKNSALSANQGYVIKTKINSMDDDIEYISEALKAHMQQYANNEGDPGHVILDGTTIVRNADGTISAVGGGGGAGITHISPIPPDVSGEEYPEGVSIFKFNYGEGALEWYNALFSLSESEYEAVTSHAPYGYVAVTTFKSDTLVNQIIQVKDSVGHVGVFGRYWTKNERQWTGKANVTNSLDGNVKKINGVKPDLYGNVNVESSRSTPKVNLTRHYIEMTSEDRIVEVDAPGIKPDNYTFTVLLNDTGLRATNWDWSIDEEREKLIIDYHANRSKAGLTVMLTIFS